jgi:hypothetical protein
LFFGFLVVSGFFNGEWMNSTFMHWLPRAGGEKGSRPGGIPAAN